MKLKKILQIVLIGCLSCGLFGWCKKKSPITGTPLDKTKTVEALKRLVGHDYITKAHDPGIPADKKLTTTLMLDHSAQTDNNAKIEFKDEMEALLSTNTAITLTNAFDESKNTFTFKFTGPAPQNKSNTVIQKGGTDLDETKLDYTSEGEPTKGIIASQEEGKKAIYFVFPIKKQEHQGIEVAASVNKTVNLKVIDREGDGKTIDVIEIGEKDVNLAPTASILTSYFIGATAQALCNHHKTNTAATNFKDNTTAENTICDVYGINSNQITLTQK